ncbi:MAG TPA: ATP-binding protein, partial [Leptolinea sp.]
VLGTRSIDSSIPHAFSEANLRMLTSLGNQTSVAIKKAQINDILLESITSLQQRSAELETSLAHQQAIQAQLIQAEKLASLGTLSAGIAHEMNNPLAGIKIYTQNLLRFQQKGLLPDELLLSNLTLIDTLVDKMTHIIKHFRSFTRLSTGSFESIDINHPINDALSMLSEQLRLHEIIVTKDLVTDRLSVKGDAIQLEQVLVNLIGNARDALIGSSKKELLLRSYHAKDSVVIEVTDTGCGIPTVNIQKIFDPFFTTKEVGKGTGLGLSIIHSIIESHGGHIEVDSIPEQGSTFRVVLPDLKEEHYE